MDLSTLTAAVDLSGVSTAILAVAGTMIVVVAGVWGIRKVIGFFGR